jgi:hypothetical protein
VPKGSKDAYQAANYWQEFKEIKEIIETVGTKGDVNNDLQVDVEDVVAVVNIILDSGQQNAREMMLVLENYGFKF